MTGRWGTIRWKRTEKVLRPTSRAPGNLQKCASDPRPPHTRQKYEQTSGQNMAPNASKQGKFDSLGAIFLFIFLPCMWGLGLQKESPNLLLVLSFIGLEAKGL